MNKQNSNKTQTNAQNVAEVKNESKKEKAMKKNNFQAEVKTVANANNESVNGVNNQERADSMQDFKVEITPEEKQQIFEWLREAKEEDLQEQQKKTEQAAVMNRIEENIANRKRVIRKMMKDFMESSKFKGKMTEDAYVYVELLDAMFLHLHLDEMEHNVFPSNTIWESVQKVKKTRELTVGTTKLQKDMLKLKDIMLAYRLAKEGMAFTEFLEPAMQKICHELQSQGISDSTLKFEVNFFIAEKFHFISKENGTEVRIYLEDGNVESVFVK